jgi:hypothetical protein
MPQRLEIAALVRHERELAVLSRDRNYVAEPRAYTHEGIAAAVHAHPQWQPHVDAPAPPGPTVRTPAHAGPPAVPVDVPRTPDRFRGRRRTALRFRLRPHACVRSKRRAPSVSQGRARTACEGHVTGPFKTLGRNLPRPAPQPEPVELVANQVWETESSTVRMRGPRGARAHAGTKMDLWGASTKYRAVKRNDEKNGGRERRCCAGPRTMGSTSPRFPAFRRSTAVHVADAKGNGHAARGVHGASR